MTEETEDKKKKSDKVSFWPMIVFVVLVLGLWIGNMVGGLYGFKTDGNTGIWGDRGTFGDMFGAVNALFSGLAFAGLIFTIILQRKDLKLQFAELARQADEAEKMATQLEIQQQLTSYQLTQSVVNNLIEVKKETINSFEYRYRDNVGNYVKKGMEAVNVMVRIATPQDISGISNRNEVLSQYCSTLFYILQYMIDSNLSDPQKKVLANTLRLQMLDSELKVLQCNAENNQHKLMLLTFLNSASSN